jgi:hypothetical protein
MGQYKDVAMEAMMRIVVFPLLGSLVAKFLVRPKMGLSYSNSGIVRNSRHAPNS